MKTDDFKKLIWEYYAEYKRQMPWRDTINPYHIFISEVMLQQTQVNRVIEKYKEFIKLFPDFESLSEASFEDVLKVWHGLGYNRRAKFLQQAAKVVVEKYNGILPSDSVLIDELPGIGPATASAIVVYAFNKPEIFIETNIRRVYIHHFFHDQINIEDKDIMLLIEKTVNVHNPREWYWALMDYGTYLAKTIENPNKKSRQYTLQSKFEGSTRQLRGKILKELLNGKKKKTDFRISDERLDTILDTLVKERFILYKDDTYEIYT